MDPDFIAWVPTATYWKNRRCFSSSWICSIQSSLVRSGPLSLEDLDPQASSVNKMKFSLLERLLLSCLFLGHKF